MWSARGMSDLIVASGVRCSLSMASRKPGGSVPRNPVMIRRLRLCGRPHQAALMTFDSTWYAPSRRRRIVWEYAGVFL